MKEDGAKKEFLSRNTEVVAGRKMKQSRITPISGMELEARRVLCGLADWVVTRSSCLEELRESVPLRLLGVREWEEWQVTEPDDVCETEICENEPSVCKLCAKWDKQTDGKCSHHQNRNDKSISLSSRVENEHEPQAGKTQNSIKQYFNTLSQSGNYQPQKTTNNSLKKSNKLGCDNTSICATPPRRKFDLFSDQDVTTVGYGGGDSDLDGWTSSQGGGEKRLCRDGESERD